MADLAPSNVVVLRQSSKTLSNGRVMFEKTCRITTPGNAIGTTTDKIPASAFGLQFVEGCSAFVKSTNSETQVGHPRVSGQDILTRNPATGVIAAQLDSTSVYFVTVRGY